MSKTSECRRTIAPTHVLNVLIIDVSRMSDLPTMRLYMPFVREPYMVYTGRGTERNAELVEWDK